MTKYSQVLLYANKDVPDFKLLRLSVLLKQKVKMSKCRDNHIKAQASKIMVWQHFFPIIIKVQ